jgi:hypothetical protein
VPRRNSTFPVGVGDPDVTGATFAVNVTDFFRDEGSPEEVMVVVVPGSWPITWLSGRLLDADSEPPR